MRLFRPCCPLRDTIENIVIDQVGSIQDYGSINQRVCSFPLQRYDRNVARLNTGFRKDVLYWHILISGCHDLKIHSTSYSLFVWCFWQSQSSTLRHNLCHLQFERQWQILDWRVSKISLIDYTIFQLIQNIFSLNARHTVRNIILKGIAQNYIWSSVKFWVSLPLNI